VVGRALRALGVSRVFRSGAERALADLDDIAVSDPALAVLLADAAGRIGTAPGVAWIYDRVLHLGSAPGVPAERVEVHALEPLLSAIAAWSLGAVHACLDVVIDIDLAAPAPDGIEPMVIDDAPSGAFTLAPDLAELSMVILAGPGVVRLGQVDALRDTAALLGVGVVNTWGAKGVFRWDSPYHYGTAGLQLRDFELAGVTSADLVITTGLDPLESPAERFALTQVLEVDPRALGALALRWTEPKPLGDRPRLYTELAAALSDRYASEQVPLSPARACADVAAVRPRGALVAADPGPAGLWLARAYPTDEPGSVVVPASNVRGFATAAALVAALDRRPALAVVSHELDEPTRALLGLAADWHRPLTLAVWGREGGVHSPEAHRVGLVGAFASPGVEVIEVPVDFGETALLESVAGDVVAWSHPEL
jgi:hypothetical protein